MKVQQMPLTLEAYRITANYYADAPQWVTDRKGNGIFENTSIRDGAVRFDSLTVYVRSGKIKERITAKIGDVLILRPDNSIAVERPSTFKALYKEVEEAAG